LTAFSDVTITVNPAIVTPPTNQPPTVNAGTNATITLPAGASLSGAITDDGLRVNVSVGARYIDAWLRAGVYEPPPKHVLAELEALNTWYYADAPRSLQPTLELARRSSTFEEVVSGLDETTALFEARRCLSCGNCFDCDNCFGVCPDNSVIKLEGRDREAAGRGYAFDYDFCKGCGICAAECPCGAIEMVPETV